ncbi:MAG TPA: polysaccharide ABC transporter ATP-binding protein [Vicinamibacterales bacterium]|nr:polysaccharide ABC transporter ATP-binding protein [Vicinamibacterales bacterium]
MSSAVAIDIAGVSKRYTIGLAERPTQFRESIASMFSAPWKRLRQLGGGRRAATDFWALRDVSFDVRIGDVVGIIGPNGAGKSTLLKVLSRITPPTSGHIDLDGRVSSLLEVGTGFHPELTGRENIFLNGAILGMYRSEIRRKFDAIVSFAELEQFIDTPVKHYSSGMSVRLAFSVAAHLEPEILIIDEVLAVGDLHFRNRCLGRMREMRGEGRTVLFVSHDLTSVRQLCNRAVLLLGGGVIGEGAPDEITRRYEQMNQDPSMGAAGAADRVNPPPHYHLHRVELRNVNGCITRSFDAGDVMEIHLWSCGRAPADSFTAEFKLYNDSDEMISFGSANPVRDTYFQSSQQHFICRLGPLPLTEGAYSLSFTVRVWNQPRWDFWEKAIGFDIERCDLFKTGHGVSNLHDGDFVIPQEWLAGD